MSEKDETLWLLVQPPHLVKRRERGKNLPKVTSKPEMCSFRPCREAPVGLSPPLQDSSSLEGKRG